MDVYMDALCKFEGCLCVYGWQVWLVYIYKKLSQGCPDKRKKDERERTNETKKPTGQISRQG